MNLIAIIGLILIILAALGQIPFLAGLLTGLILLIAGAYPHTRRL